MKRKIEYIELGLSNYYGCVEARECDGKYFLELENYDGIASKEISKELYDALVKEFGLKVYEYEDYGY